MVPCGCNSLRFRWSFVTYWSHHDVTFISLHKTKIIDQKKDIVFNEDLENEETNKKKEEKVKEKQEKEEEKGGGREEGGEGGD